MLSSIHIRLGRAALEMSQMELAMLSKLSVKTIQALESGNNGTDNSKQKTLKAIRKVFEDKGIEFRFLNNDGVAIKYIPLK